MVVLARILWVSGTLMRDNGISGSAEGKSEKLVGAGLPDERVDIKWAKMKWVGYQRFVSKRYFLIRQGYFLFRQVF
jgi:hypothetical protein